jgi:hypothetical protein
MNRPQVVPSASAETDEFTLCPAEDETRVRAREKTKDFAQFSEWLKKEPVFASWRDMADFRALLVDPPARQQLLDLCRDDVDQNFSKCFLEE